MTGVGLPLLFGVMVVVGVALLVRVLVRIRVGGLAPSAGDQRPTGSARAAREES